MDINTLLAKLRSVEHGSFLDESSSSSLKTVATQRPRRSPPRKVYQQQHEEGSAIQILASSLPLTASRSLPNVRVNERTPASHVSRLQSMEPPTYAASSVRMRGVVADPLGLYNSLMAKGEDQQAVREGSHDERIKKKTSLPEMLSQLNRATGLSSSSSSPQSSSSPPSDPAVDYAEEHVPSSLPSMQQLAREMRRTESEYSRTNAAIDQRIRHIATKTLPPQVLLDAGLHKYLQVRR